MATKSNDMGLKLEPGILNVLSLKITLERHGSGENCQECFTAMCHHYEIAGPDQTALDLFRVSDGRLARVATYLGILSIEEVDE